MSMTNIPTKAMTNGEYASLINNWQQAKCIKSRNIVVMNVVNLVFSVVNRFKTNNSQDDLFSEGVLGIMKACDTFSSEKGASFLTYARVCAKNNILDYIKNDNVIPRGSKLSFFPSPTSHSEVQKLAILADVPYDTAKKYAMIRARSSSEDADETITSDTTYETAVMLERCEQLVMQLQRVSPREYEILTRHLINEDTYKTLGNRFNISFQRVEQIIKHTKAQLGAL